MRRVLQFVALLGASLSIGLGQPGLAQTDDSKRASVRQLEEFSAGDVVRIFTFGREDLTGKFIVQPGRVISLPLLGPVDLAGKSARDVEKELAVAWEQRLGSPQSVTLEFMERAPFYILGAVNSPGAYPYRANLTAMQALALAGGLQRLSASDPRLRLDVLRERERHAKAIDQMAEMLAERARLQAELTKEKTLKVTAPLLELVNAEKANALIAEQTRLLKARAEQLSTKSAHLTELVRLTGEEIASFQLQYEALGKQEDILTRELSRVQGLRDTGFGLQSRVFEMQQRLSALSADKIGTLTGVARARSALATAKSSIGQLEEERRREVAEALIENERQYREAGLVEVSARRLMRTVGMSVGASEPKPEFRLVREGSSATELVTSAEMIGPGDVIEIWLPTEPMDPAAASSATASN